MAFTSGTRVTTGNPSKANAQMDILIANAEYLISNYSVFIGAFAQGSTSVSTGTDTFISLATTLVYDTNSFYSAGTPTRLTVPSGVSYVQLRCDWNWAGTPITNGRVKMYKNGAVFDGSGSNYWDKPDAGTCISSWVGVSAGDYFEIRAIHSTGSSRTIAIGLSIRGVP